MFNWSVLALGQWTPMSTAGIAMTHVTGGLHACGDGVYAMTGPFGGTSEADPGIGGFLWASTRAIAIRYYDNDPDAAGDDDAEATVPPPRDIVGFEPLTYAGALGHAQRIGELAQVSASYRFPDGAFVFSEIAIGRRYLIFASPNPAGDEAPIALRFDLQP